MRKKGLVFAFGVKDSKYDDPFFVQQIKEFVGKSGEKNSPKVPVINGKSISVGFQGLYGPSHFADKLGA